MGNRRTDLGERLAKRGLCRGLEWDLVSASLDVPKAMVIRKIKDYVANHDAESIDLRMSVKVADRAAGAPFCKQIVSFWFVLVCCLQNACSSGVLWFDSGGPSRASAPLGNHLHHCGT
ncbi:hypothetical protein K491DRAFT_227131 [Lophiostoma macrostomum CBS 122681]|uniref:Uncharacterized protein n=1 Tax=Lophiostoma macrostomum CBS 122681 TaxID=1314788 RepID=A0A6A6TJG6_9PLEO|nr:hypothetical protein K491DRAFT_227131 [Lophiostoma macrostomum CBS 122681]